MLNERLTGCKTTETQELQVNFNWFTCNLHFRAPITLKKADLSYMKEMRTQVSAVITGVLLAVFLMFSLVQTMVTENTYDGVYAFIGALLVISSVRTFALWDEEKRAGRPLRDSPLDDYL